MSGMFGKQLIECEETTKSLSGCRPSEAGNNESEIRSDKLVLDDSRGNEAEASMGIISPARKAKTRPLSKNVKLDPTPQSYGPLAHAWKVLNRKLFAGALSPCLITLQRRKRALGYFAGRRFTSADGVYVTDEIALNPAHFASSGAKDVLSTLAHEQAHQWQEHFGKPSRSGYHNKEWAAKMREIGLIASDTARPGGKTTGERMSHYIEPGGLFDRTANDLIAKGFALAYVERSSTAARKVALKKQQSKTRYRCASCGLNAWAKPDVYLFCGACQVKLISEIIEDD